MKSGAKGATPLKKAGTGAAPLPIPTSTKKSLDKGSNQTLSAVSSAFGMGSNEKKEEVIEVIVKIFEINWNP